MSENGITRRDVLVSAALLGAAAACAPKAASAASVLDVFAGAQERLSSQGDGAGARPLLLGAVERVEPVGAPSAPSTQVAPDLSNVDNLDWYYLNDAQLDKLRQFGFFCMLEGGGDEFFELYEMNRYALLPNFVTVDAMAHAYHLYFGHLLKNTERAYLAPALQSVSAELVQGAYNLMEALDGTAWRGAAARTLAFFTVGACLLGLQVSVPQDVADLASAELGLIYGAAGITDSALLGAMEDYSQYAPRGYYAGDAALEGYFRAMMWYGRANFPCRDEELDRCALLITVLLENGPLQEWSKIYSVTSFFAGSSDDNGYYEYAPLVRQAYGCIPDAAAIAGDASAWEAFHASTADTPAPRINSIPVWDDPDTDTLAQGQGFRFMGQRFSIDEAIFQQLVYSRVEGDAAGNYRMLPDVLDIPAAFGSDEALGLLEAAGATQFAGYSQNMEALRQGLEQAGDTLWNASLYAQWLNMLRPLCRAKGEGYPAFMQSPLWSRRCLQTFAGSYAELKHDTILYSKQVMAEMGGGDLPVRDDRGYVEPEPEVFGRLRALTQATMDGLAEYGMLGEQDAQNLERLAELAGRLETIARKELANETPTDEEFDLIRTFGGQLEHFWQEVYRDETDDPYFTARDFPAAIVADVATDPNGSCLEVATGRVSKLYVLVPMDGVLRLMSGAVYSFYQFAQPLDQRLTDSAWRQIMGIQMNDDGMLNDPAMDPIWWTQEFSLSWRTM